MSDRRRSFWLVPELLLDLVALIDHFVGIYWGRELAGVLRLQTSGMGVAYYLGSFLIHSDVWIIGNVQVFRALYILGLQFDFVRERCPCMWKLVLDRVKRVILILFVRNVVMGIGLLQKWLIWHKIYICPVDCLHLATLAWGAFRLVEGFTLELCRWLYLSPNLRLVILDVSSTRSLHKIAFIPVDRRMLFSLSLGNNLWVGLCKGISSVWRRVENVFKILPFLGIGLDWVKLAALVYPFLGVFGAGRYRGSTVRAYPDVVLFADATDHIHCLDFFSLVSKLTAGHYCIPLRLLEWLL